MKKMICAVLVAIVFGVSAAPVEAQTRSGTRVAGGAALIAVGGLLTLNSYACRPVNPSYSETDWRTGITVRGWNVTGSWAWSQCDFEMSISHPRLGSWTGTGREFIDEARSAGYSEVRQLEWVLDAQAKRFDYLRLSAGLGAIAGGALLLALSSSGTPPIVIEADPAGFEISRSIGW